MAAVVDIISHKSPRLRILDMTGSDELTEGFLDVLRANTAFKRYRAYSKGHITDDGELFLEAVHSKQANDGDKLTKFNNKDKFDLVITGNNFSESSPRLTQLLEENGTILRIASTPSNLLGEYTKLRTVTQTGDILEIITPNDKAKPDITHEEILIVEDTDHSPLDDALAQYLSHIFNRPVRRALLGELCEGTITPKTLVISAIELNRPVLASLTAEEMVSIKHITDTALNLLWLTAGDALNGTRPDFALMSGLSRALMLEQPSLHITMLDLDVTLPTPQTLKNIAAVLRQSLDSAVPDCEYVLKNGTLHISRMLPEENMNQTFREKQDEIPRLIPLKDASPARLSIGTVGQFDTLTFRQETTDESPLAPGTVEIEVKSVGLNAKVDIIPFEYSFKEK